MLFKQILSDEIVRMHYVYFAFCRAIGHREFALMLLFWLNAFIDHRWQHHSLSIFLLTLNSCKLVWTETEYSSTIYIAITKDLQLKSEIFEITIVLLYRVSNFIYVLWYRVRYLITGDLEGIPELLEPSEAG